MVRVPVDGIKSSYAASFHVAHPNYGTLHFNDWMRHHLDRTPTEHEEAALMTLIMVHHTDPYDTIRHTLPINHPYRK
jgi:hypothetical protein